MKKIVLATLMMVGLPFLSLAQNATNDLYYIPKKKKEVSEKAVPAKVVIEQPKAPTTVYTAPGSTVVIKDANGEVRDIDEYNRRYTLRENTFAMENDTLYIEEKLLNEQGEWVNGFEGSQSDYEYAMRIVRFRNPRYAIPVSSPLYWDVVYTLPSWEWNVFDDGFYAYAFPTSSNPLWWDWRFDYHWGWGWRSSWYYNSWYSPRYWYGGYWGGWYPHHHHHHYHPHYHHPHYGWAGVGGYWGGGHGWNGSSARNPGIHAGRYQNNYRGTVASSQSNSRQVSTTTNRNSRDNYVNGVRQTTHTRTGNTVRNSSTRVVNGKDGAASVRPQRSAVRTRNGESTTVRSNSVYTRPVQGQGSSYDRQSSTRSTVNNQGSSYQRKSGAAERGAYRSSGSSRSSSSGVSRSSSSSRSSGSSVSRSSSSSRSSYSSGGGGGSSRSSGGGSRGGGGGRR